MKKWVWLLLLMTFAFMTNDKRTVQANGLTLQQMIDEASPNAVIQLETKEYIGPIVVSKPITIRGQKGTVIVGNETEAIKVENTERVTLEQLTLKTAGTAVTLKSVNDVTLDRLTMPRVDVGVKANNVSQLRVTNSVIQGTEKHYANKGNGLALFNSRNIEVIGNIIDQVQDGVYIETVNTIRVENNEVTKSRYGTHFMYSENGVVTNNQYDRNVTGIMVMVTKSIELANNRISRQTGYNGTGITIYDVTGATVKNNMLEGNRVGISLQKTATVQVENNVLQMNQAALESLLSADDNRVQNNTFVGNIINARSDEQGIHLQQNYYDDYTGIDLDGDGFGDKEYVAMQSFGQWMVRKQVYQYFVESPSVVLLNKIDEQTNVVAEELLSDATPKDAKSYSSDLQWELRTGQLVIGLLLVISCIIVYRRSVRI